MAKRISFPTDFPGPNHILHSKRACKTDLDSCLQFRFRDLNGKSELECIGCSLEAFCLEVSLSHKSFTSVGW